MDKEKVDLLSNINIIQQKVISAIENSPIFEQQFDAYKALIQKLTDGLADLDDNNLKISYKNEISIILIIKKLLKRKCNAFNLEKLDAITNDMDDLKLFVGYEKYINDIDEIDKLEVEIISYDEIINLFPQKQSITDKKLFGQYYTPEFMVSNVLEMLPLKKDSFADIKIVDPACGNGAFLIKIIDTLTDYGYPIKDICHFVNMQLFGFDINPCAIFLCKISIYLKLLKYSKSIADYNYILENVSLENFKNINTITTVIDQKFNIILGNPPYFKIKNDRLKNNEEYNKVLNGQGNIYTLFMQWSLLHVENGGHICLIVPQSFRSGKYFRNIREELCKISLNEVLTIDTKKRYQVFLDAEQAILVLHLSKDNSKGRQTKISRSIDGININIVGCYDQLDLLTSESLMLPINGCANNLMLKIKKNFRRFSEIEPNLTFGNGLFVWNQNKQLLSSDYQGNYPIIYANYINDEGFEFNKAKNDINKDGSRRPFCNPNSKLENFVCNGQKLIIKRTSSIENFFRIKSSVIPNDFVSKYPKYYLENHVNFLYHKEDKNISIPVDKLLYISAYLSSDIANFIFKLMNGNTQVSATELNALPFIYKREEEVVSLMKDKSRNLNKINEIFFEIFNLTIEEIQTIKNYKEGFSR